VVLDLASAGGQEMLRRLICAGGPEGGILLTNVSGKPWLADEVLRQDRPDLIYAQLLGRPGGASAVDYTINASSGLAHATGPAAGPGPVNGALPAWDLLAGSYTALAVLAALRRRGSSGHGALLQVSLEDVAMSTLTTLGFLPEAHLTGTSRPPLGNHVFGTFGVDLPLADGNSVMLVALTPRHWRSLVEASGTCWRRPVRCGGWAGPGGWPTRRRRPRRRGSGSTRTPSWRSLLARPELPPLWITARHLWKFVGGSGDRCPRRHVLVAFPEAFSP
jgi:2-methylfumaryl-CoA isomerase